jgi:monoamine oxidase
MGGGFAGLTSGSYLHKKKIDFAMLKATSRISKLSFSASNIIDLPTSIF